MKVLIGCEESQVVTRAFRDRGHRAFSCDLEQTRGVSIWHYQMDIITLLEKTVGEWDLIILHPPCTAIAVSGNAHYGRGMPKHEQRIKSTEWTLLLWAKACAVCDHVTLENPVSVIFKHLPGPAQYIQPYQFGHLEQKKTGFALHGLPPLEETNNVYEEMMKLPRKEREKKHFMSPGPNRARDRSETYQGIADAMADQWGKYIAQTIL